MAWKLYTVAFFFTDEIDAILNNDSDSDSTASEAGPGVSTRPVSRGRRNVISPEVVAAIDASKVSCRFAADMMSAAAVSFGVNLQETNINPTTIYRMREKVRAENVSNMKENVNKEVDRVLTVRWDGKKVEKLDSAGPSRKADEEREGVVVDGVKTEIFLGAPALPAGNAEAICCAICKLLFEWKLATNVRAAGFDTTSVNSGKTKTKKVYLICF